MYCGPQRQQPPLRGPALPGSWNAIASLCKGSSQWVNEFWDSTILTGCMEKMCCKRWKHQKAGIVKLVKGEVFWAKRFQTILSPLSLPSVHLFFACWVHVWSCVAATWHLWEHPGHPHFPWFWNAWAGSSTHCMVARRPRNGQLEALGFSPVGREQLQKWWAVRAL